MRRIWLCFRPWVKPVMFLIKLITSAIHYIKSAHRKCSSLRVRRDPILLTLALVARLSIEKTKCCQLKWPTVGHTKGMKR